MINPNSFVEMLHPFELSAISDARSWTQLFDPTTNRYYYHNSVTNTTQWAPPSSTAIPLAEENGFQATTVNAAEEFGFEAIVASMTGDAGVVENLAGERLEEE